MDEAIKVYAAALHEDARMESTNVFQEARRSFLGKNAARNTGNLPLGGPAIAAVIGLHVQHIGRCVAAKLESYQRAYSKTSSIPTEEDFAFIMEEYKAVRERQVDFAAKAVREFIKTHGGGSAPLPAGYVASSLMSGSAHALDETLRKWKIWKAESKLRPATAAPSLLQKQMDVMVPAYARSEFGGDLEALASESKSSSSPLCLVFADLDKLKSINDGPGGHPAGDHALIAFTKALLRAAKGKGSVYRYGGDEFCVLLPNHSLEEATAVAARMVREVGAASVAGLSASFGVACFPESVNDPAVLVDAADKAMYAAKGEGGNRVRPGAGTT